MKAVFRIFWYVVGGVLLLIALVAAGLTIRSGFYYKESTSYIDNMMEEILPNFDIADFLPFFSESRAKTELLNLGQNEKKAINKSVEDICGVYKKYMGSEGSASKAINIRSINVVSVDDLPQANIVSMAMFDKCIGVFTFAMRKDVDGWKVSDMHMSLKPKIDEK